jgi:2-polyprenyl-3-methyl-5-hydroxy-6-metoxy-1,4-benzoquinol methylase
MKLVPLEPPGQWCLNEAVYEVIGKFGGSGKTFIEVGVGTGVLSRPLCDRGYEGLGVEFSDDAAAVARRAMADYVAAGRYRLIADDIFNLHPDGRRYSFGISLMVMEHVDDDVGFVQRIAQFLEPGGLVIIAVPGRRDRWGIEDETVGHLRRYDRSDLQRVMVEAGLRDVRVWSVAVPVANILFRAGNLLLRMSGEIGKTQLSKIDQTKMSGIREIPLKTVFPSWFSIVLNRTALYPLLVMQRLFYRTNLGLTMVAFGRR